MDKLKPIITHRFWILFGLALILPFVGYWMATGKLSAEITERREKLDSTLSGIPTGSGSPNDTWISAVQKHNELRAERNKQAHRILWKRQTELYSWPQDIRADMESCTYRGAIESGEAVTRVPNLYREDYETEVRRVWNLAEPLDPFTMKGKLEFPLEMMPRVPISEWQNRAPTFEEIWDAQEDLWLLTDLFQAVSRVNDGTNSIADAYVRKIEDIRLFGAERGSGASAAPGGMMGGGMSGMDEAAMGGMDAMMGLPGMGMMGDASGGMGGARAASADFNLSEEFSNVEFGTGGGRAGGMGMGMGMDMGGGMGFGGGSMMMPEMGGAADPAATGGMGVPTEAPKVRRYVDNDEGLPYRTRGFYMKVAVDHRRVPDLLVELTNSRWPVEIIRVHQVSLGSGTSTTGAMGGAYDLAMGGAMGGGGMYADDMATDYGGGAYDPAMAMPMGMDAAAMPLGTGGSPMMGGSMMGGSPMMGGSMMGGGSARLRGLSQAAMADPNLATVVIAGLITLYNEPEAEAEQAAPAAIDPAATPAVDASAEPTPDTTADPNVQPVPESNDAVLPENGESATETPATSETPVDEGAPAAEADHAEGISDPPPASADGNPTEPAAPDAQASPAVP